jgi:hypothetical protein
MMLSETPTNWVVIMTEPELIRAMRELWAEVEANIADLDAEQARLGALLGHTEREEIAALPLNSH